MRSRVLVLAIGLVAGAIGGCCGRVEITPGAQAELARAMIKPVLASEADPRLAPLGFLDGDWIGGDADTASEEVWTSPWGTNIVGTFRMIEKSERGSLAVQETLSINAEAEGVFMRLRHFDARMTAREEKDAPIVLRLESVEGRRAVFRKVSGSKSLDSITYERRDEHTLASEVAFTPESKRAALRFEMIRVR